MQVTRPQLPLTGPLSRADLQELNNVTVALEQTDIDAIIDDVEAALGGGVAGLNYLRNADFSLWTRGLGPLALPGGVLSELADYWLARPSYAALGSGGGGTFATYALEPDAFHQQWLYCAELHGCPGLNSLDFGQRLPARVAAALHPKCVLTLEIENQTGAAITPTVRLETCDVFENYSAVTLRLTQDLVAINNAAVEVRTAVLDLTAVGEELRNGALLSIRFAGSALSDITKHVRVYAAKLEIGTNPTSRVTERNTDASTGTVAAAPGATTSFSEDYFVNSNFHRWQTTPRTCQEDVPNWGPLGWGARPSDGNTLLMERDTVTPDVGSRFCVKLTGDGPVSGTVDFLTRLDLPTASEARRQLVFSVKLYNDTGATLTPELHISTCNSENSFSALTSRVTQLLDPCGVAAWTELRFPFDASAITNFGNGAEIFLRFPPGSLNVNTQKIKIARPRLEVGTAPTPFLSRPHYDEPVGINGAFALLAAAWATDTTLDVSAAELILKDDGGKAIFIKDFAATIDIATGPAANGLDYAGLATASTTHYIFAISRGDVHAALLSKTAVPVLPAGYIFSARVGAFVTTAASKVPKFFQQGRDVAIVRTQMFSGVAPAANTWQLLSLALLVPDIATHARGVAGSNSAHNAKLRLSPEAPAVFANKAMGEVCVILVDTGASDFDFRAAAPFQIPLKTASTLYWAASGTAATNVIQISGYTLP